MLKGNPLVRYLAKKNTYLTQTELLAKASIPVTQDNIINTEGN